MPAQLAGLGATASRRPARMSLVEAEDVPVQAVGQRATGAVAGTGATSVSSSASGPDLAEHDPAAGGAEVDRGEPRPAPAGSSQEGGGDAGVDGDVQAGGVGQVAGR